ncbi:MAG: NusA N-terminal domain-containing protein [Oscillospiraceae bacterium]
MNAEFFAAVEDIEKEKGIPREYMYEKIQQAMLAAFRKDNPEYGENVEVILDEAKSGRAGINKTSSRGGEPTDR